MYIKEDININGRVDVWNHDEPQKDAGIGGWCAAALGIGLLAWLFKKEEPKQIVVIPPAPPVHNVVEDKSSDAFAFAFFYLDCVKKVLRDKYSKQAEEFVKDFIESFSDTLEAQKPSFTDMERKILLAMHDDIRFIIESNSSKS